VRLTSSPVRSVAFPTVDDEHILLREPLGLADVEDARLLRLTDVSVPDLRRPSRHLSAIEAEGTQPTRPLRPDSG
jgi:hypothetical protein